MEKHISGLIFESIGDLIFGDFIFYVVFSKSFDSQEVKNGIPSNRNYFGRIFSGKIKVSWCVIGVFV